MSASSSAAEFKHDITADPSNFEAGVKRAAQAAAGASDQINAQFKKIGDSVAMVNKYLMGFAAVLAGGGALKKFISDANEWNFAAGKMAAQLGVTTQQASVLNVALTRLGLDSDTYLSASQKLSKQIQGNAQAFDVLGVKVRDAGGAYRPVTDIMGDVNDKLAAIKNPIEQNIAGMQVYGKGWDEVRGIIKLTAEQMQASEVRARQLGLIVGPEGAAMSKQYSMQMRELGLVGKSLEVQFGNQLLPVFTTLGSFMATEGPVMGQVFAGVLKGIAFAASATWLALKDMGNGLGAMAAQAAALLHGDLAGFRAIGQARDEEAAKNEAAYNRMKAMFADGPGAPSAPAAPNLGKGPQYHFKQKGEGEGQEKSRMGEWEAALAQQKAVLERGYMMQGQYREMTKAEELSYWQQMAAKKGLTEGEKIALSRKTAEVEMAMVRQTFDVQVKTLEAEAAQWKNNTDERLRIDREIQAKYTEGTTQYQEAAKRIAAIQRQALEQEKAVAAERVNIERQRQLSGLAIEEQALKEQQQLGLLDHAQVLAKQAEFEQKRYDIAREALQQRLKLAESDPDRNPAEVARIHAELEQLEQEHQLRLAQIKSALRVDELGPLTNTYAAAQQAIAKSIDGIINRTMTLRQALTSAWQGIRSAIVSELSTIIAKKVAAWAVEKAMAVASIATNAAEAGSGAASSMASIPYVGPVLALAAMATVFAAVSGMSSNVPSASAEGGFDIPGTLSPIVQTHPKEMILPAKHADVIRSLADNGGGAAGGGAMHVHLNVQALDGPSVRRVLVDNAHALAEGVRAAVRGNHLSGRDMP